MAWFPSVFHFFPFAQTALPIAAFHASLTPIAQTSVSHPPIVLGLPVAQHVLPSRPSTPFIVFGGPLWDAESGSQCLRSYWLQTECNTLLESSHTRVSIQSTYTWDIKLLANIRRAVPGLKPAPQESKYKQLNIGSFFPPHQYTMLPVKFIQSIVQKRMQYADIHE
jgi:hypothetical protein